MHDHVVALFQHQQQVMGAIERAKQVTPPEMNSIIRVSFISLAVYSVFIYIHQNFFLFIFLLIMPLFLPNGFPSTDTKKDTKTLKD